MMQDYPKLITTASKVGFTMYEPWFCFSPCKNNRIDAVACFKKGLPSFGAAQAEHDFYQWTNKILRLLGHNIEERPCEYPWMEIPFVTAPKFFIEPGFALTINDLRQRFSDKIKVSADSTIVLGAKAAGGQTFNTIDGTLVAHGPVNYFNHFYEEYRKF